MNKFVTIQGKKFESFISEAQIKSATKKIATQIENQYFDKNPIFIGVLNGAFLFLADLVKEINIPCNISFTKLSSYEGLNSSGKLNILLPPNINCENRHIIIVEDIIDTGNTMQLFLPELLKFKPASVAITAMFQKPDALLFRNLPIKFIGMNIPNAFVVGYGLDFNDQGRELNDLYRLIQE